MRKLKLFFACLLMAVLSIGQVWADTEATLSISKKPASSSETLTDDQSNEWAFTSDGAIAGSETNLIHVGTNNVAVTYIQLVSSGLSTANISEIHVWAAAKASTNVTIKIYIGENLLGTSEVLGNTSSSGGTEFSVTNSDNYSGEVKILVSRPSSAKGAIYFNSATVTYTTGGVTPPTTPSVTVSPASWDFGTVHGSDAASKVFSVSGSNLTAGNLTLTVPDGFSVDPSSIAVDGTLAATDVTVSKNTSTEDDYAGNLSIIGGGLASAKTVGLTMTVDADPAPTGTFELFTGDIEEGDYVIYYSGRAMNNTVTSNRLQYVEVTPSDNKITNPDEAIIWHIAASGDYWTLYNAAVEKYAGGTTTKNQGAVLAEVTDYAKWTITGSSTYDFENLGRANGSSDTGNKWLRNNGTYGFACYTSTQQGTGPLTLYKKQVAGQPKAPTFSVPGGNYENAQSVELSCETEDVTIHYTLDGTNPTDASPVYSTALAISSTTTIKAIAIKNNVSSTVASATYTIIVWQTVADVWDDITVDGPLNAHIYGYVSQTNVGGYDNNFYISDNGSTEGNQLYAYRMNMNSFSVAVGDKVKLAGDLTDYQGTKEFKYANQGATQGLVVALEAKGALQSVAVSGTPTKTEYAVNEDFDPAGLKVMGTYANGFVGEITEGITWGNDLTDGKVTESTTVHVTATVSEIASSAYDVAVTVAAKTLVSIALSYDAVEVYQGLELPKPTVTATYSEGDPEDVTSQAEFTGYDASTTGEQEITVTYTFGGHDETANYTVTVNPIFNVELAASVARNLIINSVGNTSSAPNKMIIRGKVSRLYGKNPAPTSNGELSYYISDDGTTTNEVEAFKGKYLENAEFDADNMVRVGDEVVIEGTVIYYNNTTPEFEAGNILQSLARTPEFEIDDVAELEVGAADLAVSDLTGTAESEGEITLSIDPADAATATIVNNKIHAVGAGTVTVTANLAADGIYKAATTTFSVTVKAATVKYAVTFDDNGKTGGSAPEAIADQAEGAEVTLPGNTWTKTNKLFDGWKVINNTTSAEITVTAGKFIMPASAVTIQAQWADPSEWALKYTSNVELKGNSSTKAYAEKVKITVEEVLTEFDALRACTGSAAGSCTVKVPAGTQTLHFHAAAWNAKTSTITVTMGETELLVQSLTADAGINNNSPYTLTGIPYEYYYSIDLSSYSLAEETTITFSAGSDKRFVLFGVNQEGGALPVLESIEIKGDLITKTGYKAGDALDLDGLTVEATYSLGGVAQSPVDITSDPELAMTYDPLVENQTEVTITASYKGQTDDITITGLDPVASADPKIYVSTLNVNFASVEVGESVPAAETVTVTLTNVASVTATLGGTNADAFSVSPASLTESGDITISILANTDAAASYSATLTISDGAEGAEDKTVNLSFEVTEPVTPEDPEVRKTWDLSIASYDANPTEEQVTWSATYVSMVANKATSTTAANNYLGGDANNRTSSRFYKNSTLTITPNGKEITSVVFTATSASYANALQGSEWTNASASVDGTTVTVTPTDGKNAIIAVVGGTCGFTAVQVNYKNIAPEPEPVYTEVRNGLEENRHYTVCLKKNVTAVKGATFWSLKYKNAGGTVAYLVEETAPFAAGKPYIFQATGDNEGKLEVVYGTDEVNTPVENGALRGTFVDMTASDLNAINVDPVKVYMLFNNELCPIGDNNHLDAYRAYVRFDLLTVGTPNAAPGKRVKSMPMQQNTATGMDELNASEAPVKMIIDGQMYILRGEKMYDATGRLIK